MKKLTAIITLLAMAITFTACTGKTNPSSQPLDSTEEKTLIVGVDDTFAPMGFRDEKGELVGFDIDLAKAVSEKTGYKFEFQVIDWSMKEAELNAGNIDLIWNGYSITDTRKEKVNFTQSYLENRQIVVVMSESDIKSKMDLKGKTVAVQKDSSALEAVLAQKAFAEALKNGQPIQLDTNNDAFMDLETGRTDAIVVDEVLARYYIKLRGEEKYQVLSEDFGSEEYGIGIRKTDEEILKSIDNALSSMKNDGSFQQIKDKWFSEK